MEDGKFTHRKSTEQKSIKPARSKKDRYRQ